MKPTVQNEANTTVVRSFASAHGAHVNQNSASTVYTTHVSDEERPRIVARRAARWARRISNS